MFVRGSRHRDAATSSEALTALPTAAAFLRKYSFEAVLSAVGAILAPAHAAEGMADADVSDGHGSDDEEAADDALIRSLSPTTRTQFSTGCELLEKLVSSAAIFTGDDSAELLLGTVLMATTIPAAALRRIAAAFYCRVARGEFTGTAEDASPGAVTRAAASSRIAAAREALWAVLPAGAASLPHVAALTSLLSDRDTVTAERAANALAALCGLAAPQRDAWESSARRRLQRSAAAAGGAGAGAGGSASSAAGGAAVAAPSLTTSLVLSDERIRAVAAAIASPLAAADDDGADGDAAGAAAGHFAAQRSVRLVRVAALLSTMLQPAGMAGDMADELAAASRHDAAAGGAVSSGSAHAAAAAIARSRRALAERVAAAFAATGVIATIIAAAGDDSDVLTQLNILESLPALAGTEVGAQALLDSGLMTGPLLEWAGIPQSAAAAGGAGAGAGAGGAGAGRSTAALSVPEGDPFLCTPALAALADTFSAVLAVPPANSSTPSTSAAAAAPPSAVTALAGHLRRALVPGIFAAVARECRGGGDVDAAVRAISACATLLAADASAVDAFLAPEQRLYSREWLENAVSTTADLRTAALGAVAIVLEGAAAALRRAGAVDAGVDGAAASPAAESDSAAAAGGAGAGAGSASVGSLTPSSPAAAAVAAEAAALSPAVAVAAESPFSRYCHLFDRLGAACGRDTVDAAISSLKKVRLKHLL